VNIQTLQSLRHAHVRPLYKLPYFSVCFSGIKMWTMATDDGE